MLYFFHSFPSFFRFLISIVYSCEHLLMTVMHSCMIGSTLQTSLYCTVLYFTVYTIQVMWAVYWWLHIIFSNN